MAGDDFGDGLPGKSGIFQHRIDLVGFNFKALIPGRHLPQVAGQGLCERGVLPFGIVDEQALAMLHFQLHFDLLCLLERGKRGTCTVCTSIAA